MKIKELIEELKKYDPELTVVHEGASTDNEEVTSVTKTKLRYVTEECMEIMYK